MTVFDELFAIVQARKESPAEGSYTCYLFEKGLDKILKKCGEECTEMVIAAKNHDPAELKNEIADLLYHIMVLCAEEGLDWREVEEVMEQRRKKLGNLKTMRETDRDT